MADVADQSLAGLIAQVAANAIWTCGQRIYHRAKAADEAVDHGTITARLSEILTTVDWGKFDLDELDQDAVVAYLQSPDFSALVFHLAEVVFSGAEDVVRTVLEEQTSAGLTIYGLSPRSDIARPLYAAILGAVRNAIPFVDEAHRSSALMALYLSSIERHTSNLKSWAQTDTSRYREFVDDYRTQIAHRTSTIVPPDFQDRRRIEFDQLYVAPHVVEVLPTHDPGHPDVDVAAFVKQLDRAVLLGDPGGGKSTLARKVALELTRGARPVITGGAEILLPVLVTLREYAQKRETDGLSIVEYMESQARADYQMAPPMGVFEWLLGTGRALAILDGLDELLDTSVRVSIAESVESFATQFPLTPILVTSRKVGYSQAPLDLDLFRTYSLAPFKDSEIESYAHKWFGLDESLNEEQRERIVSAFLSETQQVADLTSNPLLLSLMCAIYRGESYIPRNRPDVYEKCALLLFERWDRRRGIVVDLPFEAHVDALMKSLALWMYEDESAAAGVEESTLIRKSADYLEIELYTGARNEAEHAARQFVEYCCGRAWVFTDVGATPAGERLFYFTHRTFMEYFAASQLAREAKSIGGLMQRLLPRVRRAEWDVVAQMAIHIYAKAHAGAAAEFAVRLRDESNKQLSLEYRLNTANFGVRVLEFLVPPRHLARDLVVRLIQLNPADPYEVGMRMKLYDYSPAGPMDALFAVSADNRPAVLEGITDACSRHPELIGPVLGALSCEGYDREEGWLWDAVAGEGGILEFEATQLATTEFWLDWLLVLQMGADVNAVLARRDPTYMFRRSAVPGTLMGQPSIAAVVLSELRHKTAEVGTRVEIANQVIAYIRDTGCELPATNDWLGEVDTIIGRSRRFDVDLSKLSTDEIGVALSITFVGLAADRHHSPGRRHPLANGRGRSGTPASLEEAASLVPADLSPGIRAFLTSAQRLAVSVFRLESRPV